MTQSLASVLPLTSDTPAMLKDFAQIQQVSDILKVLSNPDRLKILCVLIHQPLNVQDIESQTGIRQPSLSQQLAVLRKHEMVTTQREGKQIFYRFEEPNILQIMQVLDRLYCQTSEVEWDKSDKKIEGS